MQAVSGRFTIPILYADNHLLAVVKPVNMPVQRDASGDPDLLTALKAWVGETYHKPGKVFLGLVHRLDRPVGGAMAFARTSKAASRLCAAFAAGEVQKRYLAVLEGDLPEPRTFEDWLCKDERTGMVRVCPQDAQGAKRAILDTRPVAHKDGLTLAEIALRTGRSHQIRVQHASRNLPLWGDNRYGRGQSGQQIALWAYRIAFAHPTTKAEMRFACSPPEDGAWRAFREETAALTRETDRETAREAARETTREADGETYE